MSKDIEDSGQYICEDCADTFPPSSVPNYKCPKCGGNCYMDPGIKLLIRERVKRRHRSDESQG